MHPTLKILSYGLSIFVIYAILVVALRTLTHHDPTDLEYFGLFSTKDILLGLLLSIVLTFTHERKKRLK